MWKYKKIVKQFRLSKQGGKGAFSLATERMCPAFRVYWFHNWSRGRIKTPNYTGKFDRFPVFFFL